VGQIDLPLKDEMFEFYKKVFRGNVKKYAKDKIDKEKFEALSKEKRKMLYARKIGKNRTLDLKEISKQMPVLCYISERRNIKPFEGKRFIIVLHFLKDLIPFLQCCIKCGLDPSETVLFYKEYLYPHREVIKNYLEERLKFKRIYSLNRVDEVLAEIQNTWQKNEKDILIIEDGGYIVPRVHTKFRTIGKKVIGAVEQTSKGEREDKGIRKLYFPVLSVASCKFKRNYEPPHIAREVVDSIRQLIRRDFSPRPALVVGYGSIGSEIARDLRGHHGMDVEVTDKDEIALAGAASHGFRIADRTEEAVKNKFLVIGTTGEGSIHKSEILAMDNETYLLSASSDQIEIDLEDLEALAEKKDEILSEGKKIGTRYTIRGTNNAINLIADGFPVNFWYRESMPNEVSDLILGLIFATAIELSQNYRKYGKKVNSEEVDKITYKYEIAKMYLQLRRKR